MMPLTVPLVVHQANTFLRSACSGVVCSTVVRDGKRVARVQTIRYVGGAAV
jgi:hypothetical protein